MCRCAGLSPLLVLVLTAAVSAADPSRILPEGQLPNDARLGPATTLNDYFPWVPPVNLATWEARKKQLREQLLIANGLWPMPPATPLNPVIHGKIERDDYTIEKVFFTSYPGHYVSGNLYRPKGRAGKLPAVLCPHGHWADGRFYDAGERAGQEQVKIGAEKTVEAARHLLHALCAQLARMGCVAFFYDMVGNADSKKIGHGAGFADADAELRLQSAMGLQTYNSIRALDFVAGLPDVDPKRIGVTGASGGGTQTFILCALDNRPAAAFPAVMVSTAMQGGCVCENCSYLRLGTGNIEITALTAPRPLGMTGARDWTIDIETKGLPELKALYALYGAEDRVMAKCFPQFGHNYNRVSREVMYNWFNRHLQLGLPEPVVEGPFVPVPLRQLSVYDESHPLPKDAVGIDSLRRYQVEVADRQLEAFRPKAASGLPEYRRVFGTALRVMVNDSLPAADAVVVMDVKQAKGDGCTIRALFLGRAAAGEQVPAVEVRGEAFDGTVVVWIHPAGKASLWQDGKLVPAARQILDHKAAILAPDVFGTGEFAGAKPHVVDSRYAGYTFGYNRPILAERIHDVLTAIGYARGLKTTKKVDLVGFEKAGPWTLLARGLCGTAVGRTAVDLDQFRFEKVTRTSDEMMLPGALKYGGLPPLGALAAPGELFVHNHSGTGSGKWLTAIYEVANAKDKYAHAAEKVEAEKVVAWLMREAPPGKPAG